MTSSIQDGALHIYESAVFYGAPLSVQPVKRHELKFFIDLVLKEGESRLRNLLPLILAKQAAGRRETGDLFDRWASQDPSFESCWKFTRLALRQMTDQAWSEGDRRRWRQLCEEARRLAIEPERALANLRRFLRPSAEEDHQKTGIPS